MRKFWAHLTGPPTPSTCAILAVLLLITGSVSLFFSPEYSAFSYVLAAMFGASAVAVAVGRSLAESSSVPASGSAKFLSSRFAGGASAKKNGLSKHREYRETAPKMSLKDQRVRFSSHESGHVVAALDSGFDVYSAYCSPGIHMGTGGQVRHSGNMFGATADPVDVYHSLVSTMAGIEAEKILMGDASPVGGMIDMQYAWSSATTLWASGWTLWQGEEWTPSMFMESARNEARRVCLRHHPALEEIAAKLGKKNMLHGKELRQIFDFHLENSKPRP